MGKIRKINRQVKATAIDMGGFKVDQPLPNFGMEQSDPFLLIHHANHLYEGGNRPSEIGVGPHPHRGFSPVTFVFKGSVHHRDSRGNNEIVEEGGLQWMSAGMGVIHSERPSKELASKGGTMEIIQVWINTPKAAKMNQPYYLPVHKKDTPLISMDNGKAEIYIYAGEYDGHQGPAHIPFPMQLLRLDLKADSIISLPTHHDQNVLIYQLNGNAVINGKSSTAKKLTVFDQEEGSIEIKSTEDSQFVFLSGRPINEPVKTYGPYVMNTQTELLEAMRDYQMGKMGILVEEFD